MCLYYESLQPYPWHLLWQVKEIKVKTSLYHYLCLVKQLLALLEVVVIEKQICPELVMGSLQKVQSSGLIQISLSNPQVWKTELEIIQEHAFWWDLRYFCFLLKLLQTQPLALNFYIFILFRMKEIFQNTARVTNFNYPNSYYESIKKQTICPANLIKINQQIQSNKAHSWWKPM